MKLKKCPECNSSKLVFIELELKSKKVKAVKIVCKRCGFDTIQAK